MAGNGRYGGGTGGAEHRYSLPAVDCARWDEAKRGSDKPGPGQGESGPVDGAIVNTMAGGRGKIMGCKYPDWRGGF